MHQCVLAIADAALITESKSTLFFSFPPPPAAWLLNSGPSPAVRNTRLRFILIDLQTPTAIRGGGPEGVIGEERVIRWRAAGGFRDRRDEGMRRSRDGMKREPRTSEAACACRVCEEEQPSTHLNRIPILFFCFTWELGLKAADYL